MALACLRMLVKCEVLGDQTRTPAGDGPASEDARRFVTFAAPSALIAEVDAASAAADRSRSATIRRALRAAVSRNRQDDDSWRDSA